MTRVFRGQIAVANFPVQHACLSKRLRRQEWCESSGIRSLHARFHDRADVERWTTAASVATRSKAQRECRQAALVRRFHRQRVPFRMLHYRHSEIAARSARRLSRTHSGASPRSDPFRRPFAPESSRTRHRFPLKARLRGDRSRRRRHTARPSRSLVPAAPPRPRGRSAIASLPRQPRELRHRTAAAFVAGLALPWQHHQEVGTQAADG